MSKYKYEVTLADPDYFVIVYSDKEITVEQAEEKAIQKMSINTYLYNVTEVNNETGERKGIDKFDRENL